MTELIFIDPFLLLKFNIYTQLLFSIRFNQLHRCESMNRLCVIKKPLKTLSLV